jgi:flagellar secretion chaperone FliS
MNPYHHYQQNQILSATPERLLLMLYDGAIKFTCQAIHGFEEENLGLAHHGIKKALAIISEFAETLDHDIGGEIAANLDALYTFMIRELTLANLRRDVDKLRTVEGLLRDLRDTWQEAIEINSREIAAGKIVKEAIGATAVVEPDGYVPLMVSR